MATHKIYPDPNMNRHTDYKLHLSFTRYPPSISLCLLEMYKNRETERKNLQYFSLFLLGII